MGAKTKSIFASRTFWSAVIGIVAGSTPILVASAEHKRITPSDVGAIVLVFCSGAGAIAGRISATDKLHTPPGFPGSNKEDYQG